MNPKELKRREADMHYCNVAKALNIPIEEVHLRAEALRQEVRLRSQDGRGRAQASRDRPALSPAAGSRRCEKG